MLKEMDMLAQDANPRAQAEFTKLQEKAFSTLVSNMRTPSLYKNNLSDPQRGMDYIERSFWERYFSKPTVPEEKVFPAWNEWTETV